MIIIGCHQNSLLTSILFESHLTYHSYHIAYKGLAVDRVRLQLDDSKGPALADKRKTLGDYSK